MKQFQYIPDAYKFEPFDIFHKIREIVSDMLGLDEEYIKYDSNFMSDLGADELDLVYILMEAEKEFGISIPNEDFLGLIGIEDIMVSSLICAVKKNKKRSY